MTSAANRIATNTVIMYIRMLFLMIISFYSSRLLLSYLGVNDFGLQSVVGSVAATFSSLKSLFSESLQRFLNFEKGKNSIEGQQSVFSIGVYVHVLLAFFFAILVGVIGYLLINNKLEIPADKIETATFVFFMSLISMVIGILSIPYDAVIIANEKMRIYALVTIVDGVLKLLAVLSLPFLPFEMLRSYAVLLIAIPISTLLFQLLYCRHFEECKIIKKIDKRLIRGILSLSGWNFFGNISFSLIHEGVNMLLNIFGGLAYNTSRTIAYSVRSYSSQLANNTFISVRPKIMQQAASADRVMLYNNICTVSRISFFTMLLPVVMLLPYTEQLLDIWLVDVPKYAALFTRLVLLAGVIRSLHEPFNMLYMSIGKIKRMMIIETVTMLISLVVIYLSLRMGFPIWMAFVEMIIMEGAIIMGLLINSKYEIGFSIILYNRKVLAPFFLTSFIALGLCFLFNHYLTSNSAVAAVFNSFLIGILYLIIAYLLLDNRERTILKGLFHFMPLGENSSRDKK